MSSETRPNVLLITVDSLRADHVSAVADSPVETPGMNRVAEDGTVYTDAFAQGPFTTFSMPSLFNARYPSSLSYVEYSDNVVGVHATDEATLPQELSALGYDTAGFHSNPLLSSLFNFDAGFDVFDADLPFANLSLPGGLKLLSNKLRRLLRTHAYIPAETITDRAVAWTEGRDTDDPFFLWTHYMDVHGPYQSKDGFIYRNKVRGEHLWQKAVHNAEEITDEEHQELLETYHEEVAYTDGAIGRLIERVDEMSDRPTLVVVTADHGEGFDEHGYYSHPHEVHDVLVWVPLLVRDPTGTVAAGRVDRPVELIDVAPMILAAAGGELPDTFEGTELVGPAEDCANDEMEPIAISEGELTPGYRAAFVSPRWKYVVDEIAQERRLFDRTGEGPEGIEVVDETEETFDRFADLVAEFRARDGATGGGTHAGDIEDEDISDRLERLGYLE